MRRFVLSALILLAAWHTAPALGVAHKSIKVYLNKADGIYSAGDTAKVFARTLEDLGPLRLLVINNRDTLENRVLNFGSDTTSRIIFSEVCKEPKGVMVILGPDGNDKFVTSAGYVVDPHIIKPGFEAPDDLYSWWEGQIKTMRKSRLRVECQEAVAPDDYKDEVRCWHVSISMPEGPNVEAYVAMPLNAGRKSLPVLIRTHGATALNIPDTRSNLRSACSYASKGAIAANVNALGIPDNEPQEYYDKLAKSELKDYSKRPLVDRQSFYFRLMFLRLVRLTDYLCSLKEWDRTRVMVNGGSQGGAQSLFLAGVDKRITHCVAMVPAMTDFGGPLVGRNAAWPRPYAKPGVAASPEGRAVLPYFDGSLLINRFRGKLYLEVGFIDTLCPATCIYAAYNNACAAEEKIIMPYVYRRHCCVDPPYSTEWTETVIARRKKFVEDFCKGK